MKNILLIANDNPIDPLGIIYLASNVDANFEVIFIKDEYDDKLKFIDVSQYDIIGFSTITGSHNTHNDIAKYLKKKGDIITLMGGPHPTFFPEKALNLDSIDFICIGEGIIALDRFVKGEKTNNIINDYSKYNGLLDPIFDINKLKTDRIIIYDVDNRGENPIKNFMGTFGCPYNCSYCFNYSYAKLYQNAKRVRYLDPKILINDIKNCVKNYNTKFIYMQDDTFILNKKWFYEVTDLIKKEIDLPYHCHIRIDIADEEKIKKLKDTGCASVTFAIENGSEEYRKKYLNRKMKNSKILEISKLLRKYDIKFRIENMVGLPFNDLQDNIETLNLNYKCHPTIGWASLFQPFTNTELGNICSKENLWSGNIDDINSGFFDESPLDLEDKIKIERLQKLFSLGVNNYFIKKLIPILIKIPLDNFYKKLYEKFKNNKYKELYNY